MLAVLVLATSFLMRQLIPEMQIGAFCHKSFQPIHHLDIALTLAREGIHLLVENPISLQEADGVLVK